MILGQTQTPGRWAAFRYMRWMVLARFLDFTDNCEMLRMQRPTLIRLYQFLTGRRRDAREKMTGGERDKERGREKESERLWLIQRQTGM
jgi:hypothetical protein